MGTKKKRTLILTIPVALILSGLVAYQYGYVRLHERIESIRVEKDVKMNTLKKYAKVIGEKEGLKKKLGGLKQQRKRCDGRLISGETPSLAAANLLDTVKNTVTGRGGRISSERVGKTEDLQDLTVISVSVDAVMPDTAALGDVLYTLETRTPSIVVNELEIRVVNIRNPRDINVKLKVSALME